MYKKGVVVIFAFLDLPLRGNFATLVETRCFSSFVPNLGVPGVAQGVVCLGQEQQQAFMIPSAHSSKIYVPPSTFESWSDYYEAFKDLPARTTSADDCAIKAGD